MELIVLLGVFQSSAQESPSGAAGSRPEPPTLEQALAAAEDVWGESSLRAPEGPGYDFFARLLPPLRYVNTDFRHYPIVLGKPDSPVKARFVSNGSGVNLLARTDTWWDAGRIPVAFSIRAGAAPAGGEAAAATAEEGYGADLDRLDGPRYAEGWLPIVELAYEAAGSEGATRAARITQEAFASVAPPFVPDDAVLFLRFRLDAAGAGKAAPPTLVARIGGDAPLAAHGSTIVAEGGRCVAWHDAAFRLDPSTRELAAPLEAGRAVHLALFTRGAPAAAPLEAPHLSAAAWEAERRRCADHWRGIVEGGARIVTGERRVDDAWRALVVGTLLLANGDVLNYSAGNMYEVTFEAECGDAARALMAFGVPRAGRFVPPLLARPLQTGIFLSDVSYKLQLLAWRHAFDGDAQRTLEQLPLVLPETEAALGWIEEATGLVPAQAYCGDISTPVHNLLANAAFWRGLRDLALVLRDLGGAEREAASARYEEAAARLRERVLAAVGRSERTDVSPPFVPIALFGAEQPYELLTQTKHGAYWNLIAPYVYDSGVFGPGSPRTAAMVDWAIRRGGLCMGMVRFDQHSGLFANEKGVDDLYTLRLIEELLKRDDADRAVVSFYGKLAQGMTRDTCIGGEGSSLVALDRHGRPMYLPPNGSANAFFLWTLRHLLVQDFDLDCDGRAETLRLLFATPRRWLADGARLEVKRAPTMFGELSLEARSDLARGRVHVEIELPPRATPSTLLRLRLPRGRIARANAGGAALPLWDRETLDLRGLRGRQSVVVEVEEEGGAR